MGYSMRLEITRVCSLNDFQLVMSLYKCHLIFLLEDQHSLKKRKLKTFKLKTRVSSSLIEYAINEALYQTCSLTKESSRKRTHTQTHTHTHKHIHTHIHTYIYTLTYIDMYIYIYIYIHTDKNY